ncbi:MAG: citrulline utilization hydrolase CtlX [Sediminibacterium sp.]
MSSPVITAKSFFANTVMMVRPAAFGFNLETAASNSFQQELKVSADEILERAIEEFDNAVHVLRSNDIAVYIVEDTLVPTKPDAIFPNNWISFHPNGTLILYPMEALNRRCERRLEVVLELQQKFNFEKILELSHFESQNLFLEGTGSVVFDHENKVAFAAISSRTSEVVFQELCKQIQYSPIMFSAFDENGQPIYHTNVVMCMGDDFVVVCLECFADKQSRELFRNEMNRLGKRVLEISVMQMNRFAGNMLLLRNNQNEKKLILSETAYQSLNNEQLDFLNEQASLVRLNIPIIETIGGGSARCMLAEVFFVGL